MSAVSVALAVVIDRAVGEPPLRVHPVARFGAAMTAIEHRLHMPSVARGGVYAGIGVGGAWLAAHVIKRVVGPTAACVLAGTIAVAGRMLEDEVRSVADALDGEDTDLARVRIARLVGRSTVSMAETDIARAAIETIAENSVDAVTATLFWGSCAGATGIIVHRAINTMDAMVGHRTERHDEFGRLCARLDDLANWLPARLSAVAVVIAMPVEARAIAHTVRRDARNHPSPNGGVIEAAFAASLGVRLGGVNRYGDIVEDRGTLGDGREPRAVDIARAVDLSRRVHAIFAIGCLLTELVVRRARASRGRRSRCAR